MAGKGWFGLSFFAQRPQDERVSCTLSGGGSRASFQLGALDYLYRHDERFAPTAFVGASAGSIIAAGLAQAADREEQKYFLGRLSGIWLGMRTPADMFTARPWYRRLQSEGPGWLEVVAPLQKPPPPRTQRIRPGILPFFRATQDAETLKTPDTPGDPVELALTPDEEVQSEWSLATLSGIAAHLGRLPRIGSDLNTIWQGVEQSRSMYRPGPVLAQLLRRDVFDPDLVAASGVTLRIAMVALESGQLRFMREDGRLVDRTDRPIDAQRHGLTLGVLASCAIPAVFRPVPIGDETYVDGGARENLPAELAIGHLGAARNYVISSQALGVPRRSNMADADIFAVVMRSTEILIDEAGRDELAYAHSADAIVVHPEIAVHDTMTVHPGLLDINRDYGWLRAAERHLDLGEPAEALHRLMTTLRMEIITLEERVLATGAPDDVAALRAAKLQLRDAVLADQTTPLPDGAHTWWTTWERHPEGPDVDPPWMPLPPVK